MEKEARPADLLNWRFQQGLYRAYYDAYVKAKLSWSQQLERKVWRVLGQAETLGSREAIDRASALLDTKFNDPVAVQWRNRVHELAEALFQTAKMQLSVPNYKAIRRGRGATLDTLDEPLFNIKGIKREFMHIRMMESEAEKLQASLLICCYHSGPFTSKFKSSERPVSSITADNCIRDRQA